MIRPTALSHAALVISNLERARNFYEEVIGLTPIPRPDFGFPGAWYAIGGNQIHLVSAANRPPSRPFPGSHFALEVEDFEATKVVLAADGIEFREARSTVAGRQLFIRDPDGNGIELRRDDGMAAGRPESQSERRKKIRPTALSHAAVRISDVDRARNFYEQVLGLSPIPRPNFGFGGAWYGVGDNQVHLISSQKRGDGIDPLGPHVALAVEDYDATKAALSEQGIELLEAPGTMAGRQLWILDPDGNTIELRDRK